MTARVQRWLDGTPDPTRIRFGPTHRFRVPTVLPSPWWLHQYGRDVCQKAAGAWKRRTT